MNHGLGGGYRPSSSGALGRRDLGGNGVDRGDDGTGALRTGVRPAVVGLRGVVHGATGEIDAGNRVAAQIHHLVERQGVDQGRHGGDRIAVVAVLAEAEVGEASLVVHAPFGDDDQGRRRAGVGDDVIVQHVRAGRVDGVHGIGRIEIDVLVVECECRMPCHCGEGQEEQARESLHRIISIATEAGMASVTY